MLAWVLHHTRLVPHEIAPIANYTMEENARYHAKGDANLDLPVNRRADIIQTVNNQGDDRIASSHYTISM